MTSGVDPSTIATARSTAEISAPTIAGVGIFGSRRGSRNRCNGPSALTWESSRCLVVTGQSAIAQAILTDRKIKVLSQSPARANKSVLSDVKKRPAQATVFIG